MSSVDIKQRKSVLWAYKKDLLGFTSHRKKREKKIKSEVKRGIREPNSEDPFELFVSLNDIRYVYYKETEKILGNTYGMCILQDFEAITPNLLARTIETVEGGGLVVLLLKGMKSLKQLYTLSMDVHSRYRTEAHDDVTARFNERFILSLGTCESCLLVDDELNVLPISKGKDIKQLPPPDPEGENKTPRQLELERIKENLAETPPEGPLIQLAKTTDQAQALLTFVATIKEKGFRSTCSLTAARGRGKSAALGVAIAAAVAYGYGNIFITSPSPENLKTLFDFILKGFDALGYLDHTDYTIIQSTNPDFNKAIVRINVHKDHRQTIQYIQPQDAHVLGHAELLVIDEAAAIPLPLVRKLMGPYLIFMASTINGYEGTGRSLSLKLISQLRDSTKSGVSGRALKEITLSEPIRYAPGDKVEKWLNKVLCLDATLKSNIHSMPPLNECKLLHVNRDTLFSFHPGAEKFLDKMMALYVASHYKNSPNDLQLMSDAPAHQLYVLVPPIDKDSKLLPEPLVVIQIALEGQISKASVYNSLSRGQRAAGDLIPWLVSQQFQDDEFAGLSGARVVRIATNPDFIGKGYGAHALKLLVDFFENKFISLSENELPDLDSDRMTRVSDSELESANLHTDDVRVRDINAMPSLFTELSERRPPALDYIGVSYGLTRDLHHFWKRSEFVPVYLRQTANELTGEHTCVMLRTLNVDDNSDPAWLGAYASDFQTRFHALLGYQFRVFAPVLACSIDESAAAGAKLDLEQLSVSSRPISKADLDAKFSFFDRKRLNSYANNMLDYHVILDLVPKIAELYFSGRLKSAVKLSGIQTLILLALGLQRKTLDDVEKEVDMQASQLLAMFVKIIKKIAAHFNDVAKAAVDASMPDNDDGVDEDDIVTGVTGGRTLLPTGGPLASLDDELKAGGQEVDREMKAKQRELIDALPLGRYAGAGVDEPEWAEAEASVKRSMKKGGAEGATVSVKTKAVKKRKGDETAEEIYQKEIGDKAEKRLKTGMKKMKHK